MMQWTWLLVAAMVGVTTCDVTFYNPMSSSSYARVQYANTNNSVIRRLGAHRDPTIQYVNFDDLYNKHNAKSTYGQRVKAPLAPDHYDQALTPSQHQGSSWDDRNEAEPEVTPPWEEEAPDLTNGWTIRKQEATTPTAYTSGPPSSKHKQTALDYVYAYSNAYSQHDNFPKRLSPKVRGPSSSTVPPKSGQVSSYADDDSAEYAHYLNTAELDAATPSAPAPVVMEASWTEERSPQHHFGPTAKPLRPTPESVRKQQNVAVKVRKMPPTTTTAATTTTTTTTETTEEATTVSGVPNVKRNRNGVQSDWRPFSATAGPSTEGTLFYSDTQQVVSKQQALSEKQQFPADNIPVFMLANEDKTEPTRVLFPSPSENEITKPEAVTPKPTFPALQSSASISVSGGPSAFPQQNQMQERPNAQNNFQHFQQNNNNQFQRPGPQNRPNRPQQQQFQGQPQQHPGQGWPNEHNFGPNEQNFRPNEQNFRPHEPNFRPNEPNMRPNENNFRPGPFNGPMRPQEQQHPPQRLPSGPVGLPPQLQMNQGRPEDDHMTIRLPLPKPVVGLGSSPQNPLPGPPIFLNPQDENDRIDGPNPQAPNNGGGGQMDNFNHIPGQFRPPQHPGQRFPPQNNFPMRPPPQGPPPPHFRPPAFFGPPPSTTTAASIIKSFFSKIFPFGARSLDPNDDVDEETALATDTYNSTESATAAAHNATL